MDATPHVMVHAYVLFGGHPESPQATSDKATLETITALGGRPIQGTSELVLRDFLDAEGFYRRVATGWGNLG